MNFWRFNLVDFLYDYGMFLAKAITIILTVFIVLIGFLVITSRNKKDSSQGDITLVSLNDGYEDMKSAIEEVVRDNEVYKQQLKTQLKKEKKEAKEKKKAAKAQAKIDKKQGTVADSALEQTDDEEVEKRVFVLDFNGDIRASEVDLLREEISAVLSFASTTDEVVLRLDSSGGMVHTYGLAASQLERIKSANLKLTICVDEVAASGGYMMACLADKLIAAPFAILGSIGVVAQLPNFHKVLKKHGVDYETFTAGEYKRTVTMFGENTEKGKEKFIEEIQDTHLLFKEFVAQARPNIDIDKVATGEVWFGKRAIEHNLIDELNTSDDFIMNLCKTADVYQVRYELKKSLGEKLSDLTVKTSTSVVSSVMQKLSNTTNLIR
jgi:serine protease SohB